MFNNLTYVQQCLREESLAKLIREQNPHFFSQSESEISNYLKKYLQSWQRVTTVLTESSGSDKSVKARYAVSVFVESTFTTIMPLFVM